MEEYKYQKLVEVLLERITALEGMADYYKAEVDKFKTENAALTQQLKDGMRVTVTVKEGN